MDTSREEAFLSAISLTKTLQWRSNWFNIWHQEGIKPFKCTICTASFVLKNQLNVHIISVHEGRKPFVCDLYEPILLINWYWCLTLNFESWHGNTSVTRYLRSQQKYNFWCGSPFTKSLIVIEPVHGGPRNFLCKFSDKNWLK